MNEWVGFIASVALFLYLMLRNKPSPQQINVPPLVPSPKAVKQAKVHVPPPKLPEIVQQSIVSSYFEKGVQYDVIGKAAPSRAHRLLENLKDRRDMVILHEIIGPPKCKRR